MMLKNPVHFYHFVDDHRYMLDGEEGQAQGVFVASCMPGLYETREYWASHMRPEGFSFGTLKKENVTCRNCCRTKIQAGTGVSK